MRLSTLDLMPKMARARNFRKPLNANPRRTEFGAFGMMDGVFRHDGNSSHRRAHSNEFAPIYINRRVYGPDHARSLRSTRKRLDYSINGPLYCHRWMRPSSDRMEMWNRNWRPRDYIEVDPEIFLKEHKYPKDELLMNPYLRYPLYHRLPLHYRLQMEEPIPVYEQVVNNKGIKLPEREGEYLFWEKWARDPNRGRPGRGKQKALKNQVGGHLSSEQYMPNTGRMGSRIEGEKFKLIPVNRHTIPYEYPRGKLDTRFYHPLKRGRKENIPGQAETSTEDNYPYDAMSELWGGVGVIRGHTFSSRMREYPEGKREFNQTWWPERYYNFKLKSLVLNTTITTTVTPYTLEQIAKCGSFDHYILMTSPAQLMSDLACSMKREMCLALNHPDVGIRNISSAINARRSSKKHAYKNNVAELLHSSFSQYAVPDHVARFINLSPFEACKLQLAFERSEPFQPFQEIDQALADADALTRLGEEKVWEDGTKEHYETKKTKMIWDDSKGLDFFMMQRLREDGTHPIHIGGRSRETRDGIREEQEKVGTFKSPDEVDMKLIRQGLKKQEMGAKHEVKEILEVEGRVYGAALINANHPEIFKYRRGHHPDLLTAKDKKFNELSEPTRTWQG